MDLSYLLVKFRKEAGLTIDELARKSGVPKGTINKIIAGTTRAPQVATLSALATAMGKTLADFDLEHAPHRAPEGFTEGEMLHLRKYRQLDSRGREAVDCLLDLEYRQSQLSSRPAPLTLAANPGEATPQELASIAADALEQVKKLK